MQFLNALIHGLVVGCDTGFGHNLACRLDSMGFKVYAGCLNVQGEGAQELKKKCSNRLYLLPLDVTKDDQISSAFRLVSSTLEDRSIFLTLLFLRMPVVLFIITFFRAMGDRE